MLPNNFQKIIKQFMYFDRILNQYNSAYKPYTTILNQYNTKFCMCILYCT